MFYIIYIYTSFEAFCCNLFVLLSLDTIGTCLSNGWDTTTVTDCLANTRRCRYNVITTVVAVMYVIFCYIGQRYNGTQFYSNHKWFAKAEQHPCDKCDPSPINQQPLKKIIVVCTHHLNMVMPWYFVENLALEKDTLQSTTFGAPSWYNSSQAVDGHRSTGHRECTRTTQEAWPTWRVDLGGIYRVGYINITSRYSKYVFGQLYFCFKYTWVNIKCS